MEVVIAEAVINKLTTMIIQHANEGIALVRNFIQEFEWLKVKLTTIRGCLEYADSQAVQDNHVKSWLDRVRDVARDAEDIVEEYAVRPLYTSSAAQSCVCKLDELLFRHRMGERIQEVKKRIESIMEDGNQLKLFLEVVPRQDEQPSSSAAGRAARRENSLLPRDSQPIAIESRLEHLISTIDESTAPVIAVVGMGGAGKTFLLKNVFNRIGQSYDHSIWLSISQLSSLHKLQCDLASHMGRLKEVKDVGEERAAELIHAGLVGKRCLIVLDDIWRAERVANIITSLGLPVNHDGQCKVLVTTRSRDVCQMLGAFHYQMELLSEQESWQLFCAHAFGGDLPPHHLEDIAHKVERQCKKLPLALKVIGASLSGCTERRLWNSKLDQLKKADLLNDPVMQILRLSYDALPPTLKVCFSYLSFFPEDELIDWEYLINLSIAEGFIPLTEDQWDVACRYFHRLANLCLLEVTERGGLITHCKIHDYLLELAMDISNESRYTFDDENAFMSAKRILLGKRMINDMNIAQSGVSCPSSLRTLSLCANPIEKIQEKLVRSMRLLRVLGVSKTKISQLPHCIGKLKLLKLLNLSCTEIKEVPVCVRSLKSLLVLDLSACEQLERLPQWIGELKCLQYLNIIACNVELPSHMPKGISELVSLRVLKSDELRLSVEDNGLKLNDVAKLTSLQELSFEIMTEEKLKSIEHGIFAKLHKMRHLSIASTFLKELLRLPQNISCLQDLQTLKLKNFALPDTVCMLTDLTRLTLEDCESSDYQQLVKMPNLVNLIIDGSTKCRQVPEAFGKSSGFPRLRFLTIQRFPLLNRLPDFEEGAMAVLEMFYIGFCPRVKNVPEGLKCLTKLREFYYTGEETDELNKGNKFWSKIKAEYLHVRIMESFL